MLNSAAIVLTHALEIWYSTLIMDTSHFKQKLEEELALLTKELEGVGRINPSNLADWEAKPADFNVLESDANERADKVEEYEANSAVLKELEIRHNNVKRALQKIVDGSGTYGICEISNEPIEPERLEANPAARTCMKHMRELSS